MFWVLMEMCINIAINQKPQLSPTIFEQLSRYVEFKADFHNVYIWGRKDPKKKWFDLPYLATDNAIEEVIKRWLADYHSPSDLIVGTRKSMEKKKKDTTK